MSDNEKNIINKEDNNIEDNLINEENNTNDTVNNIETNSSEEETVYNKSNEKIISNYNNDNSNYDKNVTIEQLTSEIDKINLKLDNTYKELFYFKNKNIELETKIEVNKGKERRILNEKDNLYKNMIEEIEKNNNYRFGDLNREINN